MSEFFIKLGKMDRRIVFLLIGFSVMLPLLFPVSCHIKPTASTERVFDAIENLPDGGNMLISMEYGPSTRPEIHPTAIALLQHCFLKNMKITITNLWPDGVFQSVEALKLVAPQFGAKKGEDWTHLGFRPGNEAVVKNIASDIRSIYTVDYDGTLLDEIPMMTDIKNVDDYDMVFSLSAGYPGTVEWLQYACDPKDVPLATSTTSIQVNEVVPYVASGQVAGIIAGMPGAAEYESLVQSKIEMMHKNDEISNGLFENLKSTKRMGIAGMGAQNIAHIVIVLLIIFGNIAYLLERRKQR